MSNKNPYQKWDFVLKNGEGGIRSLRLIDVKKPYNIWGHLSISVTY